MRLGPALAHAGAAVCLEHEKVLVAAVVLVAVITDDRACGEADIGQIE